MARKTTNPETGIENAERFIKLVLDQATEHKVVIMYGDQWPWMRNAEWRDRVLTDLRMLHVLEEPKFLPPCTLDGWVFTCYSRADRHRVEDLPLTSTLDGKPMTVWQKVKWYLTTDRATILRGQP